MVQETIIKNEFDHSYLFVKVESLKMDSYPFLMITQNNIPGLLNCRLRYIEDVAYYSYEISSKRSLEQEYNGRKIHFEDLKEIFYNIYIILKKAAEFLLDKDGFLLEPSYIFRDLETEELYCVYLPERILQSNKPDNYRELADFLLDKTDHKDEHAVNCVYQFYKMSKEEFFSFEAFWSFLEKEELMLQVEHKRMEEKRNAGNILEKPIEFEPESVMKQDAKNVAVEEKKSKLNWWIPGISAGIGLFLLLLYTFIPYFRSIAIYLLLPGFSLIGMSIILFVRNIYLRYQRIKETDWIEPTKQVTVEEYFDNILDDRTVFFEDELSYCLKWKEGHFSKEYHLTEFPVTVGKMKDSVQLYIEDASISRFHARFQEKENAVILQDLDSTNGTYVNGRKLEPGEEIPIRVNDEIQFGKIIVNVV